MPRRREEDSVQRRDLDALLEHAAVEQDRAHARRGELLQRARRAARGHPAVGDGDKSVCSSHLRAHGGRECIGMRDVAAEDEQLLYGGRCEHDCMHGRGCACSARALTCVRARTCRHPDEFEPEAVHVAGVDTGTQVVPAGDAAEEGAVAHRDHEGRHRVVDGRRRHEERAPQLRAQQSRRERARGPRARHPVRLVGDDEVKLLETVCEQWRALVGADSPADGEGRVTR